MKKVKYLSLAIAMLFVFVLNVSPSFAAVVAAADHTGGYSNSVLDSVVKKWQPPMDGTERTVRILVMISGDGLVEECEPITASGSPAADKAACDAVRSIGKFNTPPYGLPMDVFLSFWVGKTEVTPANATPAVAAAPAVAATAEAPVGRTVPNPYTEDSVSKPKSAVAVPVPAQKSSTTDAKDKKTPPQNTSHKPTIQDNRSSAVMDENDYYVKMVMRKIGPNVVFPPNIPQGEISSSLSVNVDGNGNIKGVKVSKSSGHEELDNALVKATQKTGKVNAPPNNKARELFLTFIIKNH